MNLKRKKILSYALSLSILLNAACMNQNACAIIPNETNIEKQLDKKLKRNK